MEVTKSLKEQLADSQFMLQKTYAELDKTKAEWAFDSKTNTEAAETAAASASASIEALETALAASESERARYKAALAAEEAKHKATSTRALAAEDAHAGEARERGAWEARHAGEASTADQLRAELRAAQLALDGARRDAAAVDRSHASQVRRMQEESLEQLRAALHAHGAKRAEHAAGAEAAKQAALDAATRKMENMEASHKVRRVTTAQQQKREPVSGAACLLVAFELIFSLTPSRALFIFLLGPPPPRAPLLGTRRPDSRARSDRSGRAHGDPGLPPRRRRGPGPRGRHQPHPHGLAALRRQPAALSRR